MPNSILYYHEHAISFRYLRILFEAPLMLLNFFFLAVSTGRQLSRNEGTRAESFVRLTD